MTKIRVYEFATKLSEGGAKITSKDIIQKAGELGISLENHLSFLEETEVARLKRVFSEAQNQAQGQRVRGSIIRRRRPDGSDSDGADQAAPAPEPVAVTSPAPSVVRRRSAPAAAPAVPQPEPEATVAQPEPQQLEAVEAAPAQSDSADSLTLTEAAPAFGEQLPDEPIASSAQVEDAPAPAPATEEPTGECGTLPSTEASDELPAVAASVEEVEHLGAMAPDAAMVESAPAEASQQGQENVAASLEERAAPTTEPAPEPVQAAAPSRLESRRIVVDAPTRDDGARTVSGGRSPESMPQARIGAVPAQGPVNAPRREKKDEYRAVVISMPPPVAPVTAPPPKPVMAGIRPSTRDIRKEDGEDKRKKGKKLIYDRRKEVGGDSGLRSGKGKRKKGRGDRGPDLDTPIAGGVRKVRIIETVTVSELAGMMSLKVNLVQKKLFELGRLVTVNETLDFDTATIVASEFGFESENVGFDINVYVGAEVDNPDDVVRRPPVVTIMGHVDHGKTSLLDRIQRTDIAGGEAGGITQRIGAYTVLTDKGTIIFIDTPGHEAFTAMRARGAMVTDIVILVVAADDGVMPQTIEAISHAKAADVPLIVAVNKVDKPESDPARIRRQMADQGLSPEEWGGDTVFVDVSARTGDGVDTLLEMILLQSDLLEFRASPKKRARGIVIESRLEKGRGPVATLIVQEGTLKIGDIIVAGTAWGHVRALMDDRGKFVKEAGPSYPVEILGLDKVPPASETAFVVPDEKTAKIVADYREKKDRDERLSRQRKPSLEDLMNQMGATGPERKSLKVVLKADTQGSTDAIRRGMELLSNERVELTVIHEGVGAISEADVNLAMASNGVILGFNVKPDAIAKSASENYGVQILTFNLIHELLDKTKLLMEGKLEMVETKVFTGRAEIRVVFNITKVGKIAGCIVQEGKIIRSSFVKLIRDKKEIWSGKLASLKHFKDDVKEVALGHECGMNFEGFDDMKEGDVVEAYEVVRTAGTLSG